MTAPGTEGSAVPSPDEGVGTPVRPASTSEEERWRAPLSVLTVLTAAVTGGVAVVLHPSTAMVYGAVGYLAAVAGALRAAWLVPAQVIGGTLLVASVALRLAAAPVLVLLPLVVAVVATSELLGTVAALDAPLPRGPRQGLRRAARATGLAAVVFGSVAVLASLPGPTGVWAVALASASCVALAVLAVRVAR